MADLRILDNPIAEGERILTEGERTMTICNSCRYCEGFCAVFPAMERRLHFVEADINYLANLCHNCAECYYACQYAPPHEFAINVPQTLAEVRVATYAKYSWPRENKWISMLLGALLAQFVGMPLTDHGNSSGSTFYAVIPHEIMVRAFATLAGYVFVVHIIGFLRFWRETGETLGAFFTPSALLQAAKDALTLKNLSSNGAGCTYPDEHHSNTRRIFHHFTFYGFALCFASTTIAALYHFAGRIAPYPYLSAPVMLGTLGGIGLLIGPAGLYALKRKRDEQIVDKKQDRSDVLFIALLILTSATGLALLVLRGSSAMPTLLRIHLAIVLVLFLTLPYGKFVHGIYRTAALVRSALESARGQNQSSGQSH
jgi:citrate/tricarballylate utilization protein